MKKLLTGFLIFLGLLVIVFLLGPRPSKPKLEIAFPQLPADPAALEQYVAAKEAATPYIKADNEARIIWADSTKQRTPWSIVYIHGFSASQAEGEPGHRMLAERYGCNLYLARLHAHGQAAPEPLLDFTGDAVLASAAEAVAIGNQLGEKTLVICTSTGGTLSLWLAAKAAESIDALVMYSPNIQIFDPTANVLTMPWGLQLARMVKGSNYNDWEATDAEKAYWNNHYRLEATVQLQALVKASMKPETFQAVKQPTLLCYYYKNEEEQDNTVSVPAMLAMFDQLGTPTDQKRKIAFSTVGTHPLASIHTSKDWEGVYRETCNFVEQVLGWKGVEGV